MSIRNALDALPQATPGPWDAFHVNDNGLWCIYKAVNGVVISPSTDNARLIAAAPEMAKWIMEAVPQLIEWRDQLRWLPEYADQMDKLDQLIQQAAVSHE